VIHVNIVQNQKTLLAFIPNTIWKSLLITSINSVPMNVHGSVAFVLIAKRIYFHVNAWR